MARRVPGAVILCLALIPSAYLAWTYRDMPQLGYFHDDSIYWVCAKSLAQGAGYRILSLPDQPFQTKYPPLYSLALSGIWRIQPEFPRNLPLATAFAWLAVPAFLILARLLFERLELGRVHSWTLCVLLAVNPYVCFFGFSLMSELMFSCLVLWFVLLAQPANKYASGTFTPFVAGLVGGAAYLTRAAALPLLFTAPLCLLLRKRPARAAAYFAGMIPAVAGWAWWVSSHLSASRDSVSLYHTDYFGFRAQNIFWQDLPFLIWKNLDTFLLGLGDLILFRTSNDFGAKTLSRLLACAAIAGSVRLARRTGALQFPLFAASYLLLLLVWHYPPGERFVLPVFPFLLAGFSVECVHIVEALRLSFRKREWPQRVAAAIALAGLIAVSGLWMVRSWGALRHYLPAIIEDRRELARSNRHSYNWIARSLPPEAKLLAYDDPMLYLHTGHRSCGIVIPPMAMYRRDRDRIEYLFGSLAGFAREHRLSHALITQMDFHRDVPEDQQSRVKWIVRDLPELKRVYEWGLSAVYRIGD